MTGRSLYSAKELIMKSLVLARGLVPIPAISIDVLDLIIMLVECLNSSEEFPRWVVLLPLLDVLVWLRRDCREQGAS